MLARLTAAQGISWTGDAITMVALPLTAVLVVGVSPAGLAVIGVAQALPILLLSLPAGTLVDQLARRWPVLVAADLVRAGLLLAIPLAATMGVLSLPVLALVAFASGAAGTFFDVAFAGWVPRLVHGDRLHLANARLELVRSASAVSGPALGGALVAALTAPLALLADAASFAVSALIIGSLRRDEPTTARQPVRGLRAELVAGLGFVTATPLLRAIVATAGINNLARSVGLGVAVLYLVEVGLSPADVGLAFAAGNLGLVVGAVFSRRLPRRFGMGVTMQLAVSLFGPSMLVFALAPTAWAGPAFAFALFANTFGIAVHNVSQVTLRQLLTPDHLRARVAAVTRLVIFGAVPVGTVIGGMIAEVAGLRAAMIVAGIGLCAGPLPYLLVGVRRIHNVEQVPLASQV